MSRGKPEEIKDHVSLGSLGLRSSFSLSALRSALEAEAGGKLPVFGLNTKVGELLQLGSERDATSASRPSVVHAPAEGLALRVNIGALGLGIDLQEVATMPFAEDYRTDTFYCAHFQPAEIATAILRADARTHFCGVFCAKEALKKSHPDLLNLRMDEIAVTHEAGGRPSIAVLPPARISAHTFCFTISITHTAQVAAAVCITTWG